MSYYTHTVRLTTKTINIEMANTGVVNISTVVANKVTVSEKNKQSKKHTTVESNSRCSESAPLTSLEKQACELSDGQEKNHGALRPQKLLRLIRDREGGGGGVGNLISNTHSQHCHHKNDSALRWAAV